jgi:hypothetical protein
MNRIAVLSIVVMLTSITLPSAPWDSTQGRAIGRAHADHAGSKYSFAFDNWGELPGGIGWAEYARAFYNVDLDSANSAAWFDKLIYSTVVHQLALGHCFGMANMSATMNAIGGYRGFCCPTGTYGLSVNTQYIRNSGGQITDSLAGGPADVRLRSAIKEMHCHQLSLACVLTYIDQNTSRISLNGSRMLGFFESTIAREGGPVLACITKTIYPGNAEFMVSHTVVAYKTERLSPTKGRIYVVDPNVCWYFDSGSDSLLHQGWYKDGKNYIEIDGPKWKYFGSASSVETAEQWPLNDNIVDDNSTGFLICVPISRVAPAGRSLASLGAALGNITMGIQNALELMVLSLEGTSIRQVATPDGRRLIDPGTGLLEQDDTRRIDRMVPIPLSMMPNGRSVSGKTSVFATDRPTTQHTVTFTTGPQGAQFVVAGLGVSVALNTAIPNATITAAIDRSNPMEPRVTWSSTRPGMVDLEAMHVDAAGRGWKLRLPSQVIGTTSTTVSVPLFSVPEQSPGQSSM